MPAPNRFVAVDAEILLALEAGDDECAEAVDWLSGARFFCLVTETPLHELADMHQVGADAEIKAHAGNAITQTTNFGFLTPSLEPFQHGIAAVVANRLLEQCLRDGTLNDGLTLAEAAYNGCRLLLTRRKSLLDSESDLLRMCLVDHDLSAVVPVSPANVVTYFRAVHEAIQKTTAPK